MSNRTDRDYKYSKTGWPKGYKGLIKKPAKKVIKVKEEEKK